MGLDVSLYPRAQAEQNDQHEREWEALWNRKESGEITEAEYDEERKKITPYDYKSGETPSKTNPEHFFNRRYLRSSYNEGGFNQVVDHVNGHGLYWIFEPVLIDFEEGGGNITAEHIDGLKQARERALVVAKEFEDWDRLRVTEFRAPILGEADHLWERPPTEEQVLDWGREELGKKRDDSPWSSGSYSTAKGTVFLDGFELVAITLGTPKYNWMYIPLVAYAVYRASDESVTFYREAALITAEFCEEAISMIEADGMAHLSWSG